MRDSLSSNQLKEISDSVAVTFIRYAFEALPYYSDQKFIVIAAEVSKQRKFVWLKINVESSKFPNIHLDVLLKRTEFNKWKGIDFGFKGVSYVTLKKYSYREDLQKLKFNGFMKKINDKNQSYFRNLCQSNANHLDPNYPICL